MRRYGTPGADPDYFGLVRIHLKPSGHPIVYDSNASSQLGGLQQIYSWVSSAYICMLIPMSTSSAVYNTKSKGTKTSAVSFCLKYRTYFLPFHASSLRRTALVFSGCPSVTDNFDMKIKLQERLQYHEHQLASALINSLTCHRKGLMLKGDRR